MWSWFAQLTNIMKSFADGEGAFGGVDQCIVEVIEKTKLEILDT